MSNSGFKATLLLVVALMSGGCGGVCDTCATGGEGTHESGTSATKGLVGDPCTSPADCQTFAGFPATCLKSIEGINYVWTEGYCTFGCNWEEPQCPAGTVCEGLNDYFEKAAFCLRPCTADTDCRKDYQCKGDFMVCLSDVQLCTNDFECSDNKKCNIKKGRCE